MRESSFVVVVGVLPTQLPPLSLSLSYHHWYLTLPQALISAPESSRERAEALWPAVLGLLAGLEALAARGTVESEDNNLAAARETCIEAMLATAR